MYSYFATKLMYTNLLRITDPKKRYFPNCRLPSGLLLLARWRC